MILIIIHYAKKKTAISAEANLVSLMVEIFKQKYIWKGTLYLTKMPLEILCLPLSIRICIFYDKINGQK